MSAASSNSPEMVYPALFYGADEEAARRQRLFLTLSALEYVFLILSATLGLKYGLAYVPKSAFYVVYALIFMLFVAVLLFRTASRPEEIWYQCRALAKSIKTSAWRHCMRAEPFAETKSPKAAFRAYLADILKANSHIGHRITGLGPEGGQVTEAMEQIRALPLKERRAYYGERRIRDQQGWYRRKAIANRRKVKVWVAACLALFVLAGATVAFEVADTHFVGGLAWPTEPLIVAASSVLGWMQIKKFNELASAYTLTAHEIGLLLDELDEQNSEKAFSDFVNQAELAFSREHTQWVARQVSA